MKINLFWPPVKRPGHLAWGQGTADRIRPRPGAWGTAKLFEMVQYAVESMDIHNDMIEH